jgi:hypothetical protein
VAQQAWTQAVMLNASRDQVPVGVVSAHETIYVYEAWSLRFALASSCRTTWSELY